MNTVTDTHALLWWFTDSPKLGAKATKIFQGCENGKSVIFIPSIVIAEALSIFDKKKMAFNFTQLFARISKSENYIIIPLDLPVLQEMFELREVPELHDKIIVSTAKYRSAADYERCHPKKSSLLKNNLVGQKRRISSGYFHIPLTRC